MAFLLYQLADLLADNQPVTNKPTQRMGELVRRARNNVGLSQANLAERIFRNPATVSDTENGKPEVGATTMAMIAAALNKPITYFLPPDIRTKLKLDDLDADEQE